MTSEKDDLEVGDIAANAAQEAQDHPAHVDERAPKPLEQVKIEPRGEEEATAATSSSAVSALESLGSQSKTIVAAANEGEIKQIGVASLQANEDAFLKSTVASLKMINDNDSQDDSYMYDAPALKATPPLKTDPNTRRANLKADDDSVPEAETHGNNNIQCDISPEQARAITNIIERDLELKASAKKAPPTLMNGPAETPGAQRIIGENQVQEHNEQSDHLGDSTNHSIWSIKSSQERRAHPFVGASNELVARRVDDEYVPSQVATPVDEKTFSKTNHQQKGSSKTMLYAAVAGILLVTIIVVASVCGSGLCTSSNDDESANAAPLSHRHSQTQDFKLQLEQALGDAYFEEDGSVDSPRTKALQWILHDDPLQLEPDSENLLQRFVVTLFYYETTKETPWLVCNPPKGNEQDICYYDRTPESSGAKAQQYDRWLIGSSECFWAGLNCQQGEMVEMACRGNGLNGELPTELALLTKLTTLDFYKNELQGTLPTELAQLLELERLAVQVNKIRGTIPPSIPKALANLTTLQIHRNPITGTLPTEIGLMQQMSHLFLAYTQVSGTLPSELFGLTTLSNLFLDGSKITGTIPTSISNLSSLWQLIWNDGLVSGTIPSELGLLKSLVSLELSNNVGLEGTIPENLFVDLTDLSYLILSGSNLSGTLSTNIGHMPMLEWLDLSDNQFTGTIPEEMSNLSDLRRLRLNGNNWTGAVPSKVCFALPADVKVVADCAPDRVTGSIAMPCECCTQCCDPADGVCIIE